MDAKDAISELQDRAGKRLLGSQKVVMAAPEPQIVIAGGFGCGKTHIACTKGLVLSAVFPGNRGLISRYHATDLEDSTIPVFFDVCPPSWIRSYNKQSKRCVLKNGSEILFRHLHDAKAATKSRRVGANLGWALIDQLEECELAHYNSILGRLRFARVPKHFLISTMNPAGHDDFYNLFFRGMDEEIDRLPLNGKYFAVRRVGNRLGIAINSEENRISNGGFVPDSYFDELLDSYDAAWVARYLRCSFADFAGKVYREYTRESVHNIRPFSIPSHWPTVVPIDVGGDVPWGIPVMRVDDRGNLIVTHEFYKDTVNTQEVALWIKTNCAWKNNDTLYVIDWENKLAMLELSEYGIHCQPAIKKVHPGILRTGSYFHVRTGLRLPSWYKETQAAEQYERYKDSGSPRIFIFDTLQNTRKELDNYLWDPNKVNTPRKKNDHLCDALRYAVMKRPDPGTLPAEDKFSNLRAVDPMAAREWEAFDRRVQARMDKKSGRTGLHELEPEIIADRSFASKPSDRGKVEWEG